MKNPIEWILYLIKGNIRFLILSIVSLIISPILAWISFSVTKKLFDLISLKDKEINVIFLICIVIFIVKIAQMILSEGSRLIQECINLRFSEKIELYLMEFVEPITLTLIETPKYRNDLNVLRQTIGRMPQIIDSLISLVQTIGVSTIYLVLIGKYNVYYSILLVTCGLPIVYYYAKYAKDYDTNMRSVIQERIELSNISEMLVEPSYQKDMVLFSNRKYFLSKWMKVYRKKSGIIINFQKRYFYRNIVINSLSPMIFMLIQLHLISRLISGELSLGDIVATTTAIGIIESNFKIINRPITGLKNFSIFLKNAKDFLIHYKKNGYLDRFKVHEIMRIDLKKLCFTYPNEEKNALTNISLSLTKGRIVAFVGHNGSGKSTLAKVLAGLHDVPQNSIFINSVDLNHIDRRTYIKRLSLLNQDFSRFPLTTYENIVLDEIDDIKKIHIDGFLKNRPFLIQSELYQKLNIRLGTQYLLSKQLSGGQWQRIALSRALYKECDLLIIDEGTTEIDPVTENKIFKYLNTIKNEKIIILVTHNLNLAALSDQIYVFKDGSLVEEGTHYDLIKLSGEYAQMHGGIQNEI